MRQMDLRIAPLIVLLAAPLALAGCASEGSVDQANTQASSAMAAASQSKTEADKAMSTAQEALKMAKEANAQAKEASEKADKMYQRSLRK